jgi:ATP synthase protein I
VKDQAATDQSVPAARGDGPPEQNAGMVIFSYLLAGMLFYGAVGWLISRWAHVPIIFPVGMIVGLVLAIVRILYKYGRA